MFDFRCTASNKTAQKSQTPALKESLPSCANKKQFPVEQKVDYIRYVYDTYSNIIAWVPLLVYWSFRVRKCVYVCHLFSGSYKCYLNQISLHVFLKHLLLLYLELQQISGNFFGNLWNFTITKSFVIFYIPYFWATAIIILYMITSNTEGGSNRTSVGSVGVNNLPGKNYKTIYTMII